MTRRRKRLKVKKLIIAIIILVLMISLCGYLLYLIINGNKVEKDTNGKKGNPSDHYSEYVITNKDSKIYKLDKEGYKEAGKIAKDIELTLDSIDDIGEYFKIKDINNEYYIYYDDVNKIDSKTTIFEQDRYKKYIPFNQNIVTKDVTHFYNENKDLLYTLNESFDLPIIIKDNDYYGVEFNDMLVYISKDDVDKTKDNHNTDKTNTNHIGTLNYHFFWDDETEEPSKCDQIICHSKKQFKSHLDLFNEMGLLTITMKEAEMYIDGKVQLPKSVLITIDDGWRIELGIKMLNEYKMHGTVFLITGAYDPANYKEGNDYVEFHSHTHNMHDPGKCPGGQGGGIKCLPHDEILNDLKASSEKLGGSTVLCYPFYEYNDYSISIVKEAGYTMAFAGESSYLDNHFKVGSNKYNIPRFVIVTYTSLSDLRTYLS